METNEIVNNKELKDILQGIEEENAKQRAYLKKQLFYTKIFAGAMVLILVFVIMVVCTLLPQLMNTLNSATATLEKASITLDEVAAAVEDATDIMTDVDSLVTDSQTTMTTALDKINGIDIEGLNGAITDLEDVVEPMARLMNTLK